MHVFDTMSTLCLMMTNIIAKVRPTDRHIVGQLHRQKCTSQRRNFKAIQIMPWAAWSSGIVSACGVTGREIESRQSIWW
jgi:hypothetical protein